MASNLTTTKIVLATNNPGKAKEFGAILKDFSVDVVSQSEFNVGEIEETGLTFVENALIKARAVAEISGLPTIADDSGLEVDALSGAPGIYSARFAGVKATDAQNLQKLLEDIAEVEDAKRTARFQCVIVYLRHALDPTPLIFQGTWEGLLLREPSGEDGFGYDPIFYVPTHDCSAANLTAEAKNAISHRGQALQAFIKGFQ